MKGQVVPIFKVFDGADKKIVIPVYQRNYDWTPKQCERLFDDLEEMISQKRSKHFFGAVVGYNEDSFTWVVIDGQQRMTTVSLLILALAHAIEAGEIEAGEVGLAGKLGRNYLEHSQDSEYKLKLKPVKDDRDSYGKLFGSEEGFNEKSKLTVNYRYFRERLRKTQFDAATLWNKGVCNLEVMLLDLENEDDPQRIFESINSTGLALKESDKIRNFLLMGLPQAKQNLVYEKFWNEMEKNVDFGTDSFIRWFLVAQTTKTPKESNVFEAFKEYAKKRGQSGETLAKDLLEFSVLARELRDAKTGYKVIDRRLRRANLVLGDVQKPLLWLSYRDVKAGTITPEDFAEMVAIIESYVFRRVVANVATNALNKIFANAYSELQKLRKNGERYSDVLTYMLVNRGQSGRFPDDVEFAEAFKTRDFYRMRINYRAYFFEFMERGESKDVVDIASYILNHDLTVEHIMPQRLNKQWREDLGPEAEKIHSTWMNRVANLTITGYNSEYSNLPFAKKLAMADGLSQSPYFLNGYIKQQESWGPEQLEARNEILKERALGFWPFPQTTFEPVKPVLPFEPMGTDKNFKGESIVAVEIEGTKKAVTSWSEMTLVALRIFLNMNRDAVLSLVSTTGMLIDDNIEEALAEKKGWRQIDPALAVLLATNTESKVNLLRKVCDAVGYDPDDVLFYLRGSKNDDAEDTIDELPTSPYAGLIALKPLVEEAEGSPLAESETSDLRENLSKALAEHPVDNPMEQLGGQNLQAFLSQHDAEEITPEQALACLALYEQMAQMMGQSIVHQAILGGEVGKLLTALEATA